MLRRASWVALYVLVFWPLVASGGYRGWPLLITELVALIGVLCWLLSEVAQSRLEWRRSSADLPLALLVLFVLAQIVLGNRPLVRWAFAPATAEPGLVTAFPVPWVGVGSVEPRQTLESLLLFATYLAAYVLVVTLVRRRRHLDRLVRSVIGAGALVAALGLVDFLTGASQWVWWRPLRPVTRVAWSFVNPDHFAAWLAMGLALGIGYVISRRGAGPRPPVGHILASRAQREAALRAYFPLAAVSVMALALLFTLSRGAALALVVTVIAMLVVLGRRHDVRWPLVLLGALLLVTLGYGLWIGLDPFLQRLAAVHDYRARWLQVVTSIPMLRDFPLFGVGLGAYKEIYPHYQTEALRPGHVAYPYAHNDLLQLVIELGLVGTVLVVAIIWALGADLFRAHLWGHGRCPLSGASGTAAQRHDPRSVGIGLGAVAAVACLLVHSTLDFSARIPANGILAAVCVAIASVALHTRFSSAGNIHIGLVRVALRPLAAACIVTGAVVVAAGMTVVMVRSPLTDTALREPTSPARIEAVLRLDHANVRALEARATLRADTARTLWKSADAARNPGHSSATREESRRLILGAVEDWRRMLTCVPTSPAVHESLAWTAQAAALIDVPAAELHRAVAIAHLQRAVTLAPADPFLYASLAAVAIGAPSPRRELALQAARAAIEREPSLLGALADQVLPDDLTDVEWVAIVPDTALERARLAALLEDRGRVDTAHAVYERALGAAVAADAPLVRWLYARFLHGQGASLRAAGVLEPATRTEPDNPELWLALGDARAALRDPTALEAYRQAAFRGEQRAPRGVPAPKLFDGAPAAMDGVIAQRVATGRVQPLRYRRAFAQYLIERKRWTDALDEWDEIAAEAPDDALAQFSRGVALEGLGNSSAALDAYRKAGTLERSVEVRTRLAAKLWEAGQYAQAVDEWRSVTAQAPGDVSARLALARALLHVGDRLGALREYQAAVRLAPDNVEAQRGFTRLGGLLPGG